jgi:hypothetical protein
LSSSHNIRRRVPRPPAPSFEHQRKPSQPRYVTVTSSTLSRVYLSTTFVPQARPRTTRIWESADPQTQ